MESISNFSEKMNQLINNNFDSFNESRIGKVIVPIVSLILILYVASVRPKLPSYVEKLFVNPVFRLVIISYIIYRAGSCPQTALLIAAAFLITLHMINKQKVEEKVKEVVKKEVKEQFSF